MNHIYGVNKYTYARYCTETDIFFKTTRAGSGSRFGGEISRSGSGKKVRIRPDPQHWTEDGAQVGVKRLWWSFYLVCRPSWQEIPGSLHMLFPPPPSYRLLLVITVSKTQFLLAPTVIRPVSIPLVSTCGPWENTALLKCHHPHCVALSFYIIFLSL